MISARSVFLLSFAWILNLLFSSSFHFQSGNDNADARAALSRADFLRAIGGSESVLAQNRLEWFDVAASLGGDCIAQRADGDCFFNSTSFCLNDLRRPTDDPSQLQWTETLVRTRCARLISDPALFVLDYGTRPALWARVWSWRGNQGDPPAEVAIADDALRAEYCRYIVLPGKYGGPVEQRCVSMLFRVRILIYCQKLGAS